MGQVDRKVGVYDAAGNPINEGNPLQVTGTFTSSGGSIGQADKSLFTEGASLASPIAGVYNETLGADPSEDSAIALRATVKRALHINPRDASGNEIGTSAHPLRTDPTGATNQPVSDGGGTLTVDAIDGGIVALGSTTDAEATANGSLIAIGKRIRTLLAGTLTVGISGTPAVTISGTPTVTISGTPAVTANVGTTGGLALDATLTGGTTKAIGRGQVDDTSTATPAEDAYGDLRITPKRGLHTNLRDQAGAELATSGNPLRTDPTGGTTQPVSDAGGTLTTDSVDGGHATLGTTTDAEATGNGTLIAIAKRLRTLLGGTGSLTANIGTTNGLALDATLTGGTQKAIGRAQLDDVSTVLPAEDAYADLRITAQRGLHVNLRNNAGTELGTSGAPVRVDPTGTTKQGVTEADGDNGALGTTTDAEATANGTLIAITKRIRTLLGAALTVDTELPAAAALSDTLTNPTAPMVGSALLVWDSANTRWMRALNAESASGSAFDAGILATQPVVFNTPDTKYYRMISAASTTGGADGTRIQTNALLAYNGTNFRLLRQDSADNLQVAGGAAHGVAVSGNPVRTGGKAINAEVTAVTNGQTADLVTDLTGKLIVLPFANPENLIAGATSDIVDATSTAIIAAQAASVRSYITHLIVQNSHATVGTWVNIKDGSTVLQSVYAPSGGGGASLSFPTPLKGTAATALNAVCETTGANVRVSASGYKGV